MTNDRISKLSERFKARKEKPQTDEETAPVRKRQRRTLYLDTQVLEDFFNVHEQLNRELYPAVIEKSLLLESIIQYGLDHLEEVKSKLFAQESQE